MAGRRYSMESRIAARRMRRNRNVSGIVALRHNGRVELPLDRPSSDYEVESGGGTICLSRRDALNAESRRNAEATDSASHRWLGQAG